MDTIKSNCHEILASLLASSPFLHEIIAPDSVPNIEIRKFSCSQQDLNNRLLSDGIKYMIISWLLNIPILKNKMDASQGNISK